MMRLYGDYDGIGLNHLEILYQEGERDLAIRFFELLGCQVIDTPQVADTGTTYMMVLPDPKDDDPINNVFYLSQIRAPQRDMEKQLAASMARDPELAQGIAAYRERARTVPFGVPHFGIRFPSFASIEPVLARLENIEDAQLNSRVSARIVRPDSPQSLSDNLIQAFVYTDVIANGFFCFGQLIELQAQKEPQYIAAEA